MGASKRLDISKKYQIGLSDHQLQRFLENMSLLLLFLFLYSRWNQCATCRKTLIRQSFCHRDNLSLRL